MGLVILLVIAGLFISYLIADEFSTIAIQKGYNDRKYFWFCFLFGIAGYLMVVALPKKENEKNKDFYVQNNSNKKNIKTSNTETEMVGNFPAYNFSDDSGIKQCPKCGVCHDSNSKVCPTCKHKYDEAN